MTIRVSPYKGSFPGATPQTNKDRACTYAHNGVEFMRASAILIEQLPGRPNVYLPLMHLSIELLVKAHAANADASFKPKANLHSTHKNLEAHKKEIKMFANILKNPKKTEIIDELEKAWDMARYGEAVILTDASDLKDAQQIAMELAEEFYKKTGVPLLATHFPVKLKKTPAA